jgi:hypothetical protein
LMLLLLPLQGISSASFSFPESPEKRTISLVPYVHTVLVVAELFLIGSPLSAFRNRSLYRRLWNSKRLGPVTSKPEFTGCLRYFQICVYLVLQRTYLSGQKTGFPNVNLFPSFCLKIFSSSSKTNGFLDIELRKDVLLTVL